MDRRCGSSRQFGCLMVYGSLVFLLPAVGADVCYIHQSAVSGGVARWVAPPDPCSCTQTRPGGVNTCREGEEPPSGYLDEVLFTRDEDRLRKWFGCENRDDVPGDFNLIDCEDVLRNGSTTSGLYTIYPAGALPGITVYCDMDTDGGGWIVFQRRQDGSEEFYRDWVTYRDGFGNMSAEFWLGNDNLRRLTEAGDWKLRVDLLYWDGSRAYSKYGVFRVSGEQFTLEVGGKVPGGGGGDSLVSHSGESFSTRDQDNDSFMAGSCAQDFRGGWWYSSSCILSHLNGPYEDCDRAISGDSQGIVWYTFKSNFDSMKGAEMKIRKTL